MDTHSHGHETTWAKYLRKLKEQPLIPLGVLATCVAFAGASRQMRHGNRESFNRWLRFRVLAQGFTVAAAVIGGYQLAQERREARKVTAASDKNVDTTVGVLEAKYEDHEAERKRFEARLKEAEEIHRLEVRAEENVKNQVRNNR